MFCKPRRIIPILAALLLCYGSQAFAAASRGEVVGRLEDFRQFFIDFQQAPDSAIPGDLLADCYGVIIMRQYKAGFVFGGKYGHGVILMHDRYTGEWSGPAFVRNAEGSWGFQIGGQAIDAIILIMNQAGVDMLVKTRFTIGVDASAAAGPVGRDIGGQVGPGTALLTYSRAKGLYAGASFEGGAMFNNDAYNQALYGRPVGLRDVLLDRRVAAPPEANQIINTLKRYAVRNSSRPEWLMPTNDPVPDRNYQDGGAYAPERRGEGFDNNPGEYQDKYYDRQTYVDRDPVVMEQRAATRPPEVSDPNYYTRNRDAGGAVVGSGFNEYDRNRDLVPTTDASSYPVDQFADPYAADSRYGGRTGAETGVAAPEPSSFPDRGYDEKVQLDLEARRAAIAAREAAEAARAAAEKADEAARRAARGY